VILVAIVAGGLRLSAVQAEQPQRYVFYGYAPPTVGNYTLPGAAATNYTQVPSRLDIVGIYDNTHVEVYNLTTKSLIASRTINRMELYTLLLGSRWSGREVPAAGGSYVKVVSDKIASVCLSGLAGDFNSILAGGGAGPGGAGLFVFDNYGFSTFYPSIEGGFFGKEFIFLSTPTWWMPSPYAFERNVYHIFGVEQSHVDIYNSTGKVAGIDIAANSFAKISLSNWTVYRLVSTGRVLVGAFTTESFLSLPAATGGFVGRAFYGILAGNQWGEPSRTDRESLVVLAEEGSDISVYDVRRPGIQIALSGPDVKRSLAAGELWFNSTLFSEIPVRIDSTGNISVLMGNGGWHWGTLHLTGLHLSVSPEQMGDAVAFVGARAGQRFSFYAPTEAIIFAPTDLLVEIDGEPYTLREDDHITLPSGVHTIRPDHPVIVEVLGATSISSDMSLVRRYTVYDSWGGYLISPQMLDLAYPAPPPLGGMGELVVYVGGAAAVVVVLAALMALRRRGKPKAAP